MENHNTSGLAIASFVLGIFSFLFGWIPIFGQIPSILAIVFGFVGLGNIRKNEKMNGKAFAIIGIVLGAFWFVLGIFLISIGIGWGIISNLLVP